MFCKKPKPLLLTLLGVVFICCLQAQHDKDQQPAATTTSFNFQAHFDTLYQHSAKQFSFNGRNRQDFERWQRAFRPKLKGTDPADCNGNTQNCGYVVKAEKEGEEDEGTYTLERWHIWTEPTVPPPFILLRPRIRQEVTLVIDASWTWQKQPKLYAGVYGGDANRRPPE